MVDQGKVGLGLALVVSLVMLKLRTWFTIVDSGSDEAGTVTEAVVTDVVATAV